MIVVVFQPHGMSTFLNVPTSLFYNQEVSETLNVSNLVKISRRTGMKFNMLMCHCIGKAASSVKEFYLLPVGGKLMQYDSIAVNTIVANRDGDVSSCDILCDVVGFYYEAFQ